MSISIKKRTVDWNTDTAKNKRLWISFWEIKLPYFCFNYCRYKTITRLSSVCIRVFSF